MSIRPLAYHTHTHPFNGPLSRTTWVSRYQKGITNLDFTGARDSEWQWHQMGRMQVCTSLQTYNHASTPPLSFLQAGCPSCLPINSVKALKLTSKACLIAITVTCIFQSFTYKVKGKVFPYSLPSVGPGADPGVQAVSPQVT